MWGLSCTSRHSPRNIAVDLLPLISFLTSRKLHVLICCLSIPFLALMSLIHMVAESICRLLEASAATVRIMNKHELRHVWILVWTLLSYPTRKLSLQLIMNDIEVGKRVQKHQVGKQNYWEVFKDIRSIDFFPAHHHPKFEK